MTCLIQGSEGTMATEAQWAEESRMVARERLGCVALSPP